MGKDMRLMKVPALNGSQTVQQLSAQSLNQWNDRIIRSRCDPPPLAEPNYPWRSDVRQRLNDVVALQRGWDGYSGVGVSYTNASFAEQLITAVCHSCNVAPQIVPGSRGDLFVEWHSELGDVEIHIVGPYNVRGTYENVKTGVVIEDEPFSLDVAKVADWLREISEDALNDRAAA